MVNVLFLDIHVEGIEVYANAWMTDIIDESICLRSRVDHVGFEPIQRLNRQPNAMIRRNRPKPLQTGHRAATFLLTLIVRNVPGFSNRRVHGAGQYLSANCLSDSQTGRYILDAILNNVR